MSHVVNRLLGQPRIVCAGRADHILERRDAALLAALAIDGPMAREKAAAWLWPDAARSAAANNLRQRLFRLKLAAGCDLVGSAPVMRLADGATTDLASDADGMLLGTLDYAGNGPLAEWVDGARSRRRSARRHALSATAAAHDDAGRWAEALACTERLLQDDCADESAHAGRMRLHYLLGDRAAALSAWAECRRLLRDEAGAEPGPATCALAALIERSARPPSTPDAAPPPAALLRPPLLIGRENAWRTLVQALRRRRSALMLGEPGIGKSRLLEEFAEAHDALPVHRARPGDARLPYAFARRLFGTLLARHPLPGGWVAAELARLLPDSGVLGTAPNGRLEPLRLQRAAEQALAGWKLPLLLIDDIQFADEASCELLLGALAASNRGLPPAILAARSAELPPAVARWADDHALARLTLPTLTPAQVAALVDALALPGRAAVDWAPTLARRSGGNPLFVLQLLLSAHDSGAGSADAAEMPTDIARAVERRLGQLSSPALRLARIAALAGADFALPLAADVLGVHAIDLADALAELERAQLMTGAAFAYDLIGETVLAGVPQALAQLLHGGLAGTLQQRGAPPAAIAEHWFSAGDWVQAATQYEQAASRARRVARPVDEIEWLDRATLCHQRAGDSVAAFDCRVRAAQAAIDGEDAGAAARRAQSLQADAATESQRLDADLKLANQRLVVRDAETALQLCNASVMTARRIGDRARELQALSLAGSAHAMSGRIDEALTTFESALGLIDTADADDQRGFWGCYGFTLQSAGRNADAVAPLRRAAQISEGAGDLANAVTIHGTLSISLWQLGECDAAIAAAERALLQWRAVGTPAGVSGAVLHVNLGVYYNAVGRFREALAMHDVAVASLRAGGAAVWLAMAELHLASVWVALGQPARARQSMSPLPADAPATVRNRRLVLEARIDTLRDRPALAALQSGLAFPPDVMPASRNDARLALAALLPADESLALATSIREQSINRHPPAAQSALILQADALRRLGRVADAAAAARQALADSQRTVALDLGPAQLCWLAFQALAAADLRAEADAALHRGADWIRAAVPHVPEPFVESFLRRHPVNVQLLAAAAMRGLRRMDRTRDNERVWRLRRASSVGADRSRHQGRCCVRSRASSPTPLHRAVGACRVHSRCPNC